MNEVLQFVCNQDHSALIILQELENALLHEMVTEMDVQSRKRVILQGDEMHISNTFSQHSECGATGSSYYIKNNNSKARCIV